MSGQTAVHPNRPTEAQELELALAVRDACLDAARHAYDDARTDGLCAEGAWECAVDALRSLDVTALLQAHSR